MRHVAKRPHLIALDPTSLRLGERRSPPTVVRLNCILHASLLEPILPERETEASALKRISFPKMALIDVHDIDIPELVAAAI